MSNTLIVPDTAEPQRSYDDAIYAHIPADARAALRASGDVISRFLASPLGRREAKTSTPKARTIKPYAN